MLKIYSKKIVNIFLLLFPIALVAYLYSLPWAPPVELYTLGKTGEVALTLRKSNGEIYKLKIPQPHEKPVTLAAVDILKVESELPVAAKLNVDEYYQLNNDFEGFGSLRFKGHIQKSILMVSVFVIACFFCFVHLFTILEKKDRVITTVSFLIHFSILGLILASHYPGYFTPDSFQYFSDASKYIHSVFTGYFYTSFFMVAFQVFPFVGLITIINIMAIALCLTYFYFLARKYKVQKFYFISASLFFLIPTNAVLTILASRDILSNWVLCLTLIYLYVFFLEKRTDRFSRICLFGLVLLCSLLRQENIYVLPVALLLLSWKQHKANLKFSAIVTVTTLLICMSLDFTFKKQKAVYQTTLLVNPLSTILTSKYGSTMPPEVDQRLGTYFKNELLFKYPSEEDIPSFHAGGVNHPFSMESYEQFRNAAIMYMLENPIEFLKNRWYVTKGMYGITPYHISFMTDDYFRNHAVYDSMTEVPERLKFPKLEKPDNFLQPFLDFTSNHPGWLFNSYLIPFVLLLALCLRSKRFSIFRSLLVVLFLRSLLVSLTSPATYFKYNYILWLMAFFVIPVFLYERRIILDNNANTI